MSFTQSMENEFIDRLTRIIEANLSNEQFGVSDLAREIGMSRSNLHRKVKSVAGVSISKFIRQVRLEKARKLLQETSSTTTEVAFECGFHSVSYFTKCFHDHYGYPPGKVRKDEFEGLSSDDPQRDASHISTSKNRRVFIAIISAIILVTTASVLILILKPFSARDQSLDKSIAVLPFRNDSPDEEKMYFINGTMEAILNNLSKIQDLRVVSRNSVEQYRNNPKSTLEIAEEMNVSYLLEGSGLKDGDNIRLTVQLIDGKNDKHLWSDSYYRKTEEIFELQSEIAQLVAGEIYVLITPEEKQLIEKIPTQSMMANDLYQKGREEYLRQNGRKALKRAEDLFEAALIFDSTYAKVYIGLARIQWIKHYWDTYFSEDFLDSALVLANMALSFDPQLSEAYTFRGNYYSAMGNSEKALEEFNKAIQLNPNDWQAYQGLGRHYLDYDLVKSLENYERAISLHRGPQLANILWSLGKVIETAGFVEEAEHYYREAMKLNGDSIRYYEGMAYIHNWQGDYKKALVYREKVYAIDSSRIDNLWSLGRIYLKLGRNEESLRFYQKWHERFKASGDVALYELYRMAIAYWENGYQVEADYFFNEQLTMMDQENELGRSRTKLLWIYLDWAAIYAFRGEKNKALENLRIFKEKQSMSVVVLYMMNIEPFLFDNIRDEPEFQQIVRDIEAKYQAEHERVKNWLEENDML